MKILGIPLDCLTQKEVKETLHKFLAEPRLHHITTVNPEFLLLAEKNTDFRTALLTADLRVVDGFGITEVAKESAFRPERILNNPILPKFGLNSFPPARDTGIGFAIA